MKKLFTSLPYILQYRCHYRVLYSPTKPIPTSSLTKYLLDNLYILVRTAQHNSLVSLSANQIGFDYRVFTALRKYFIIPGQWIDYTNITLEHYELIINPRIIKYAKYKIKDFYYCPSFTGIKVAVWTPISQVIRYFSLTHSHDGSSKLIPCEKTLVGFHTRIWDHELRHLDGFLSLHEAICRKYIYVTESERANPIMVEYMKLVKGYIETFSEKNIPKFVNKYQSSPIDLYSIADRITPEMKSAFNRDFQTLQYLIKNKEKH